MNRRGFCKGLAMVPVAAVAVTVGAREHTWSWRTPPHLRPAFVHTGNQTGRGYSGCYGGTLREYQLQALHAMEKRSVFYEYSMGKDEFLRRYAK